MHQDKLFFLAFSITLPHNEWENTYGRDGIPLRTKENALFGRFAGNLNGVSFSVM